MDNLAGSQQGEERVKVGAACRGRRPPATASGRALGAPWPRFVTRSRDARVCERDVFSYLFSLLLSSRLL